MTDSTEKIVNKNKPKTEILVTPDDITKKRNNGGLSFQEMLLVDMNNKIENSATKDDVDNLKEHNQAQEDVLSKVKEIQDNCVVNNTQKVFKSLGIKISVLAALGGGVFYGIKELLTEIFKTLK